LSTTYPELNLTTFPDDIDTKYVWIDPSASDLENITHYNTHYAAGEFTEANAILEANPTLKQMIVNAAKLNRIEHMIMAIQKYYKDDVQTFLINATGIDASDISLVDTRTIEEFAGDVDDAIALLNKTALTGTTAGTASALTVANTGFTLDDFARIVVKLHADVAANATLNVNSTGAKAIYNNANEQISAGVLKQGSIVMFVYNATNTRWYLVSGGGSKDPTYNTVTATTITADSVVGATYN
jgi:hypothetical protein